MKYENIIAKMTLRQKALLVTGRNSWRTQDFPELGIPSLLVSDGTNGIRFQIGSGEEEPPAFRDSLGSSFDTQEAIARTHVATCYPSGSAMASTWDRELMYETGQRLASECRSMGIGVLLGPGMNIRRHPLTARNFEYYSEDPVVSGETAAALVRGLQDSGIGTSIKHFVCHNSDDRRTRVNVNVSERALHEIYLAGFERAVRKAQPATIMTCYNYLNGKAVDADRHILQDIVRNDWGFEGAFVCDWGSVKDIVAATEAGLDLQMPFSGTSTAELIKAVENGTLSETKLDERVDHVLDLVFRYAVQTIEETDQKRNHAQAVKAETEAMVLLKNENNVLPLKGKKLAVIGNIARNPQIVGSGCAIVKANEIDHPYEMIEAWCREHEITLTYAEGYRETDTAADPLLFAEAVKAAEEADEVLLFVGTYPPEEGDTFNRKTMALPSVQEELISLIGRTNCRTAVLVSAGEVITMPWADDVSSIMDMWYGGEGLGSALVQILFGQVSPSGKLTVTIPEKEEDCPAYLNFTANPYEITYGEDVYVGYRWYDRRKMNPKYPFGHGLSYTSFSYHDACVVSADEQNVMVSVQITNTGNVSGDEIVQVYTEPLNPDMQRPVRELKDYARIHLEPGETKTVSFTLDSRCFAFYDAINHEWANDASAYRIHFAASSRDLRASVDCERKVTVRGFRQLSRLAGYHEVFTNRITRDLLFGFLLDHELITPDMNTEATEKALAGTFWPIRAHMDMNAQGTITYQMVDDLIDRMNKALLEAE